MGRQIRPAGVLVCSDHIASEAQESLKTLNFSRVVLGEINLLVIERFCLSPAHFRGSPVIKLGPLPSAATLGLEVGSSRSGATCWRLRGRCWWRIACYADLDICYCKPPTRIISLALNKINVQL
jgi:hypothetical protein